MKKASFYLLTDAHYVSKKTWTEGKPFTFRERSDQIALKATPEILDTFLAEILADGETDTVLFTGDNVNNCDLLSHEEFRERLERLSAAGKKVYVIYATHDYSGAGDDNNTFVGCRYTAAGTEPIPSMRKSQLYDYYYDYGPKQAISVHRGSGSYTVRLCEGVRLIAVMDNGNGGGYCGLDKDGITWLKQELENAARAGAYVLLAVHHPVLPPWDVYAEVADDELYGGYRELRALLCAHNVRAVFTGHTHVQNIRKYSDGCGRWFYDVSTVALANAAGKMRKITVDADAGVCDVTSIGIAGIHGLDTGDRSAFDFLYPLNFPGIWERLIPLAANDFDAFLALAEGYLPTGQLKKHKTLLRQAAKAVQKIRLSSAAKLGGVWRMLSADEKQALRERKLLAAVYVILRHIYAGNAPYTPDTPEYKALCGLTRRADGMRKLIPIKRVKKIIPEGASLTEIAQDFLYNCRTGDDDAIRIDLK